MNRYKGIDYTFLPESYWLDSTVLQALLRDVKGVQRRKMIVDYYENGNIDQLEDTFLQASLSEDQRQRFGLIHPSFMGGEYLPDCTAGETEIARIELESTLAPKSRRKTLWCPVVGIILISAGLSMPDKVFSK